MPDDRAILNEVKDLSRSSSQSASLIEIGASERRVTGTIGVPYDAIACAMSLCGHLWIVQPAVANQPITARAGGA